MMKLEEIKTALEDRNLSKVGEAIGYTRAYLAAIRSGRMINPSYECVRKLSEYLEQRKEK